MPSEQSEVLGRLYDEWSEIFASEPGIDEVRGLFEGLGALAREPEGVACVEMVCGTVPALMLTPAGADSDKVLLCLHGGGYIGGSMHSHRKMFAHLAKAAGCRALIPDYRRAPEHVYPGACDDVAISFGWLLDLGFAPSNIGLVGDSAGGALALALQFRLRDAGQTQPAASALMSPFLDLVGEGATLLANNGQDRIVSIATIEATCSAYLAGTDPRNPMVSPLFGNFAGLAPLYIQVGGAEALLDDSRRTVTAAANAGVDVAIDIYPDMQHVFQIMAGHAPEADAAIARMGEWLRQKLAVQTS